MVVMAPGHLRIRHLFILVGRILDGSLYTSGTYPHLLPLASPAVNNRCVVPPDMCKTCGWLGLSLHYEKSGLDSTRLTYNGRCGKTLDLVTFCVGESHWGIRCPPSSMPWAPLCGDTTIITAGHSVIVYAIAMLAVQTQLSQP